MKLGFIGLPGSEKTTIYNVLTKNKSNTSGILENQLFTIPVPDSRVDVLSNMYKPKKTIYAQIEFFLPADSGTQKEMMWAHVRNCDAIVHVVRNFIGFGCDKPNPYKDFVELDQEMIFADFVLVEKRLERINLDKKRGKKINTEELTLLTDCYNLLENNVQLRKKPELALSPSLKGFAFVSAKPMLVLFNNEDQDENIPDINEILSTETCMAIRGRLEHEIIQMSEEDAETFFSEFNISASAVDRVISMSYTILGLISFFTVGEDEVRAWTIKKNTSAVDAAETIHSDIKKGFIRAEVLSYDDLIEAGTYQEAKKRGTVRLEGKTYIVKDGDIINFRFNV